MESKNFHFKKAKTELSAEASERLASDITRLIKDKKSPHLDNEMFYLLLDPFCKELGITVNMNVPAERYASKESWLGAQILSNVKRSRSNIYRPLLMAWLSYYYPSKFQQLCRRYALSYDDYNGIPDASKSVREVYSSQLVALAERKKRLGTALSPLPKNDDFEQQVNHKVSSEAIVGEGAKLVHPNEPLTKPIKNDDVEPVGTLHSETEPRIGSKTEVSLPQKKRVNLNPILLSLAGLTVVILLFWGAWSFFENRDSEFKTTANVSDRHPWDDISERQWSLESYKWLLDYAKRADREQLIESASSGNNNGRVLLAVLYRSGEMNAPTENTSTYSFDEISKFLEPACDENHGRACGLLGIHYFDGIGVPSDPRKGLEYYSLGCDLGVAILCRSLASRFVNRNNDLPFDWGKSFSFHVKACDHGHRDSCWHATRGYFDGDGGEPNLEKSKEYYNKFCPDPNTGQCVDVETQMNRFRGIHYEKQ